MENAPTPILYAVYIDHHSVAPAKSFSRFKPSMSLVMTKCLIWLGQVKKQVKTASPFNIARFSPFMVYVSISRVMLYVRGF
ncbi:MAG: hypothetical protein ACJARD_001678 [Alphaproteobacteria bacterium]